MALRTSAARLYVGITTDTLGFIEIRRLSYWSASIRTRSAKPFRVDADRLMILRKRPLDSGRSLADLLPRGPQSFPGKPEGVFSRPNST